MCEYCPVAPQLPQDRTTPTFFGKPLEVKQMIAAMQDMMGKGALNIVTDDISTLIEKALIRN